jgi:hypothetical protein
MQSLTISAKMNYIKMRHPFPPEILSQIKERIEIMHDTCKKSVIFRKSTLNIETNMCVVNFYNPFACSFMESDYLDTAIELVLFFFLYSHGHGLRIYEVPANFFTRRHVNDDAIGC